MEFDASPRNINEILSRNIEYIIPKNQRKYVWGETQWSELFEDVFLIEQSKDYAHFIGSFVFSKSAGNSKYFIVDGQQRLITISVLLCCLANALIEAEEPKAAQSILSTYLKGNNNGEDYDKITRDDGLFFLADVINELTQNHRITDESLNSIYKANFESKDRYNKKIKECFLYFQKRVQELIDKKKSSKKEYILQLKDRLVFCNGIEIIVASERDGYRVFETLNARGIPLEQHELIKNYFYNYLELSQPDRL